MLLWVEFAIIEKHGKEGERYMRVLATAAFSFSVAVLTAVLMPESGWYVYAAAALAVSAMAALLFGRRRRWGRRAALIGFSAAVARKHGLQKTRITLRGGETAENQGAYRVIEKVRGHGRCERTCVFGKQTHQQIEYQKICGVDKSHFSKVED